MSLLRPLLCFVGIVLIILFPLLLLLLIIWWLRLRKEPESTVMGKRSKAMGTPTRTTSAIEIPPEALAAAAQAAPSSAPVAVTSPVISEPEGVSFTVTEPLAEMVAPVESEAPIAPVESEAPAAPVIPDNLKRLEGIGPKVAGLLEAAGILTFAQLAETDVARLRELLDAANLRFLDPTTWPEQAALAAKGDWAAFEKLAGELKGGRRVS